MSIPFSNTNLRVPRGFGNLLEGLAREVLRNQPQDIPTFGALYFSALLKEREESGLDPAEWGAKLEDRFYNNNAFKLEKEREADGSSEPQQEAVGAVHKNSTADTLGGIEHEFIQPVHISTVSSANFNIFDEVPGVESWAGGEIGSKASEDICSAELDLSPVAPYGGIANVDVCAEGLRVPGRVGPESEGGTPCVDTRNSTADTLGGIEHEFIQPVHISTVSSANFNIFDEVPGVESCEDICGAELDPSPVAPYGGIANVDVCAEGLRVPGGVGPVSEGDFNLTSAMGTPTLLPSPLRDAGGTPATGSSGSFLLDFGDEQVGKTQDVVPGNAAEDDPPLGTALDSAREEDPPLGTALYSAGEEDPPLGTALDSAREEDPPLGTALDSAGEEDPPLGTALGSAGEEDPPLGTALMSAVEDDPTLGTALDSAREEDPPLGTALGSAGEDDPTLGTALDSAREKDPPLGTALASAREEDPPLGTALASAREEDPPLGTALESAREESSTDSKADDEADAREETKTHAMVADAESDGISVGDVQDKSKDEVSIAAEEQDTKESGEPEQDIGSEEQEQVKESEEQEQAKESEEQEQGKESQEQIQGDVLEEQVPAVIPEDSMDEKEPKEEREDADERNDGDEQELAQQDEEKVGPVGGEGDHKEECSQPQEEEDVMDIPLDDPEANKAAAKIQAGFRGHMTRKKMKDDKPQEETQQDQKD